MYICICIHLGGRQGGREREREIHKDRERNNNNDNEINHLHLAFSILLISLKIYDDEMEFPLTLLRRSGTPMDTNKWIKAR